MGLAMDNDVKEDSHLSSNEETPLHRASTSDKRSPSSLAHANSPWKRRKAERYQKREMGETPDHQRRLSRGRSRRPGQMHFEAGGGEERHQPSLISSRTLKGILPRIQIPRQQKAGRSRYPHDSEAHVTSRQEPSDRFFRSRSSHEAISTEAHESRQIARSSSERVRRQVPRQLIQDAPRPHGRVNTRMAKSRTWEEDRHRHTSQETEGELDGLFRFIGSFSRASWRFLTRIPDELSQLSEGTVRLLEQILPCFGRPQNLVADE